MAGSPADSPEGRDFSLTSTTTNRSTDEFWYLFPEIPVAIWSETYSLISSIRCLKLWSVSSPDS